METMRQDLSRRRHEALIAEAKRRGARKRRAGLAPMIEGLEDRRLLSGSVTVLTTADTVNGNVSSIAALIANPGSDGLISLREAIEASNNTAATKTSPNVITIPAGTYTLTQGELDVLNDVTITSNTSGTPVIEAGTSSSNGTSKIFSFNPFNDSTEEPTVAAGFAVNLSGLTLQFGKNPLQFTSSGKSEGGAFDFDAGLDGGGSLSLNNVVVANNQTTAGDGGGIALFDGGTISITNSTISSNTANGTSSGGGGSGGGIYVGDNYSNPLTMTVTGTIITGNKTAGNAPGSGGGVFSFAGADGSGDASNTIALHGDMITSNTAAAGQDGGGVDVYGGLTVDQGTLVSGNAAGRWGGGLFLSGTANITSTTVINNSAAGGLGGTGINEGGGGIFANDSSSNVTVNDSRIVGNTAVVGGSQLDGDGASSFGGILNAANNWFGTNTPSASFFGAGVKTLTTTPFLKETFSAVPTTVGAGKTSTLTASITTNSNAQTGFTIPDGTPVSFSGGTIGSVNPSNPTTTSGTATSTFTALLTPGTGNVSATIDNQTLSIQLTVIGTPTANAQSVSVAFNTPKAITLTGSDPDSPPLTLTYAISANPANGMLSNFNPATGAVTYTPNPGYHGTDGFTFTVTNGTNISTAATVTLNVAPGTPTANPQPVIVNENSPTALTLTGSDPDSPPLPLTYAISANPVNGMLSNFNPATGAVTYTPNPGYTGSDSFKFTVSNGTNVSQAATVSINVVQVAATVSGTVGVSWGTSGTATLQTNADGLRLLPAGRNTDLPWLGINKLTITLSQAETLSSGDVSVTGVNISNYGPVTISGSGTTYTIILAQPINAADKVTVTIGNANIATFTRRLDVLPGDFNDDGVVNAQDATLVRNEYLFLNGASPTVFGDINGDGVVDVNDYNTVRRLIGTRLP